MGTHFEINVERAGGVEGVLNSEFYKRESARVKSAFKWRARFRTRHEEEVRKRQRARKRRRQYGVAGLSPLTLAVLDLEGEEGTPIFSTPRPSIPTQGEDSGTHQRSREGALIICRFQTSPSTVAVIKDRDKEKIGFPFGSKDEPEKGILDKDIFETARRECGEEIFWQLDVEVPIHGEDNLVGKVAVSRDHIVHVLACDFPDDTAMRAGEDQEAVFRVPASKIREYIREGIFLPTHATAFVMWEEWLRKKGEKID